MSLFNGRSIEFFEGGERGFLAMRNLTVFISMLVGSVVVVLLAARGTLSPEIFGMYLLAGAGVYSFGKWQDEKSIRSKIDSTTEPDITNTTINQPDKVNVAGDVKATRKKK